MKSSKLSFLLVILLASSVSLVAVYSWDPLHVAEDQNLFQPGTQPGETSVFTDLQNCGTCHGGYDKDVEPLHNWKGSMMAQAARDPLWLAAVTVSVGPITVAPAGIAVLTAFLLTSGLGVFGTKKQDPDVDAADHTAFRDEPA